MITTQEIKKIYKRLKVARCTNADASYNAIRLKKHLELRKTVAIIDGEIKGKNAAEREINAQEFLPELYHALDEAESYADRKKLALEIAQLNVDELRARLRVDEMSNNSKPHIHGNEEL